MSTRHLEDTFPSLRSTSYEITSPEDRRYNCIAWAAGDAGRWWDPVRPDGYWPLEERDTSLRGWIEAFRALGYEECDSRESEPGVQKVAIYAKGDEPMHVAVQLPCGAWSSKCGGLQDIRHTLEGLEGEEYGSVAVVLRRAMPDS